MKNCKDCKVELENKFDVRCPKCKKKNTERRKYQRRHIHRLRMLKK